MVLRNAITLLTDRFRQASSRRRAWRVLKTQFASVAHIEVIEDRTLLSADCYASLFAGPRLASLDSADSAILEASFNALLPGSHVDLTVVDWNAIAGSSIDVNSFLTELQTDLGVSTPAQALYADATLAQVLTAAADAAPADGDTAGLHAALLDLAGDVDVSELSGTVALSDILNVTLPDGSFADVDLDALNFVTGLIQLYNYDNVLTTNDPVTISGSVIGDPSIAQLTLWAQVIEPPIIDAVVHEQDQFYSAAVRIRMNVDLVDITVPLDTSLTVSNLDFYVDVARAQGEVTSIQTRDPGQPQVTVDASHGVANLYVGEINDSLFFNRNHVIDPATDLDFTTVGSLNTILGPTLAVETRGYAEGTAPFASTLEFFGPFPETQTAGTSTTFISNAVQDLLDSSEVQLTLLGAPVPDPTSGIRTILADTLDEPLVNVGSTVADPLLNFLGTGVGEMDVTIMHANCPPLAIDDQVATNEDTPVTIDVLANDTDVDGSGIDPTSVTVVIAPSHGSIAVDSATGAVTYSPAADFNGMDTFTYTVSDTEGAESAPATVTITVRPVNDVPVALDDIYVTVEDQTLTVNAPGVLTNDSDADGDALSSILVSGPGNGTLLLNSDGAFTYTPDEDFAGTDSFTYRANDGKANSNIATVTITVDSVNDAPVAADDEFATPQGTSLTVSAPGILENDADADGDTLSAILVASPGNGSLTLNSDGALVYTPDSGFTGIDSFTYQASDGTSSSNVATVSITVTAVNNAPVALNDAYSTPEDTTLSVTAPGVLANDTDPDGDSLTSVLVGGPAHGTVQFNTDGSFSYTPAPDFNGTDSFTYRASDGISASSIAQVTLTVSPVRDAPVAADDSYSTAEDTALHVAASGVLANDSDTDGDTLTSVLISGPSNGTLTLNTDGSFDYTPDGNFVGTDAFTYRASDGVATSNVATVTLTVTPVNDLPVAQNDVYTTDEDTSLSVTPPGVLLNDTDADGDPLSSILVSGPDNGILALNPDGSFSYTPDADFNGTDFFRYRASDGTSSSSAATVTITVTPVNDTPVAIDDDYTTPKDTTLNVAGPGVLENDRDPDGDRLSSILVSGPGHGTLTLNSDGSFSYLPESSFTGADTFSYRADDGTAESNPATVTITVGAANNAPVAQDDSYTTAEDTTLTINAPGVLSNDSDVDGDPLTVILVSGPDNGTLTLNSDGSFSYTPDNNFNGTDSFTYRANDGTSVSSTATVAITVTTVNDAPVAVDDAYGTVEDVPLNVGAPGILENDSDADGDQLTSILMSEPVNGTLTLNTDGSFTYTPDSNFNGTDSFTYFATDGDASSSPATVVITVAPVNDAPVARDDTYTATEDVTLNVTAPGVLGNDSDADGDSLTAILVSGPGNGSLSLNSDGSFSYTGDSDFNGSDTFTYYVNDGAFSSGLATVTINIMPINDAPVAADDLFSTAENTPLNIAPPGLLDNDTDPDGDVLTSLLISGPDNGSLTLNDDGSFSYTPSNGFVGEDDFRYVANDGVANSNTATVTVTVGAVNEAPIALDDEFSTAEDETLTVSAPGVLQNDSDADGDPLTGELIARPDHGALTFNADGSFSYTPNHDFSGTDTFTYRASDGISTSGIARVSITVGSTNDRPVAVNDFYSTAQDTFLSIYAPGILDNDSDPDGDPLTPILISGPNLGTLTLHPDGSFEYMPHSGINCTDIFSYKVTDGQLDSNNATVRIAIGNDTMSPTLTITPDGTATSDDPILFTFRFNEPVEEFAADDVVIANGTAGTFSAVSYFEYTLEVSPDASGTVTVSVAAGAAHDLSGHGNEAASASVTSTVASQPSQLALDDGGGDYQMMRDGDDLVVRRTSGGEVFREPAASVLRLMITGSAGDDRVTVINSGIAVSTQIQFSGGDGNDYFDASLATGVVNLIGNGGDDVLIGGSANDTLTGGSGADELAGGSGNDSLDGSGGTGDTLEGGDGDDTLDGGSGNDLIREFVSGDVLLSNSAFIGRGNDVVISIERARISGSAFAQTLDASTFFTPQLTSVTLIGGGGDDILFGSPGSDVLVGNGGNDRIEGGAGGDRIFGGGNADTLIGGAGNDFMKAQGASGDWLIGGEGNDTLNGGRGIDRLREAGDVDFTLASTSLTGMGTDALIAIEIAELDGGPSDNRIDASAFQAARGFVQIRGNGGNDWLIGSPGRDVLIGGDGNDTLQGKEGDDTLSGGPGNDRITGHSGNDWIEAAQGYDIIYGGNGNDTVPGGGNADDIIIGGNGDDWLSGNDGNDTLVGGTGHDDASPGDVFADNTATIDELFTIDPLPDWVDQV
ncbi:tandem-95 repeat protein [bacterium]|nr:tandem-95 repeat protein [bacterium]